MNIIETGAESKLKMDNLFFTNLSFERNNNEAERDMSFRIARKIETEGARHEVTVKVQLSDSGNNIRVNLIAVGIFSLEDADNLSEETRNSITNRNTVAIMFPYIRSQISLLTTQPDFPPIVLPAMNINALLDLQDNDTQ